MITVTNHKLNPSINIKMPFLKINQINFYLTKLTIFAYVLFFPSIGYSHPVEEALSKIQTLRDTIIGLQNTRVHLDKTYTNATTRAAIEKLEAADKILNDPALQKIGYIASTLEAYKLENKWELAQHAVRLGEKEKAIDYLADISSSILSDPLADAAMSDREFIPLLSEPRFLAIIDTWRIAKRMGTGSPIFSPFKEELSLEERVAGLSLFWSEVRARFVHFDKVSDLNWDLVYMNHLNKIIDAKKTEDYYRILLQLAPLLKDGHTNIYPPEELNNKFFGKPPIGTKKIAGRVFVTWVGNIALSEKISVGDEIVAIDEIQVHDYVKKRIDPFVSSSTPQDREVRNYSYHLLAGDLMTPMKLTLKNRQGKEIVETIRRNLTTNLPTNEPFEFKILDGNIAYLALDQFSTKAAGKAMVQAMPRILASKGLILDIRNNGGGSTENGWEVLSYLSDQPIPQNHYTRRIERALFSHSQDSIQLGEQFFSKQNYFKKREAIFTGPVIVLAGPKTFSAAEDFLTAFEVMKRGRIVGSTTAGSTGQPFLLALPGGGTARICAKRDAYPDGREFVGKGIAPHITVVETIDDFYEKKDAVLDRAIQEILALDLSK